MLRIVIEGLAAVFRDDEQVTDPAVLHALDGLTYEDERFTDYLSDTGEEGVMASALVGGGSLHFAHRDAAPWLIATTEYRSNRSLSESELRLLVEYTMGQWSDGIGENWTCESQDRCGFRVMCLTAGDGVPDDYPSMRLIEEPTPS